jgi:anhydro-N-acetylmuramic acid kinase
MDIWCERNRGERFDRDGEWAASGTVNPALLARMSADPYFKKVSPKSTGLEHFNLAWLEDALSATGRKLDPADVQATLLELTATTIAASLKTSEPEAGRAILCGGGAYNTALVGRLRALLPGVQVESSAAHGIPPEWVEATAFAWLARLRLIGKAGNAPSVAYTRAISQLVKRLHASEWTRPTSDCRTTTSIESSLSSNSTLESCTRPGTSACRCSSG